MESNNTSVDIGMQAGQTFISRYESMPSLIPKHRQHLIIKLQKACSLLAEAKVTGDSIKLNKTHDIISQLLK